MKSRRLYSRCDTSAATAHFVPAPYVVAAVHGTDTALLDMRAERYYTLDAVGSRVWQLLSGRHTVQQIAVELGEEFDAPLDRIESDLRALLDRLEEASLIVPTQDALTP